MNNIFQETYVIVIDDGRWLLDSLLDYLDDVGFRTAGFTVPEEALQSIKTNPPDVCLVDLRLQDMNGEQVINEILASAPWVRCLIYTGSMYQISENLKTLGLSQKDVIHKPVQDFDLLSRRIAGLI